MDDKHVGVESSGNSGISREIVGDLKIQISASILDRDVEVHSDDLKISCNSPLAATVFSTASASAADDVKELQTTSNIDAEIKDGGSERVLLHNSDGGMTSAAAAAALIVETDDDVLQLEDAFGADLKDLLVMRSDAQLPPLREDKNTVVLYDIEHHKDHPEDVPDPCPCSLNQDSRYMWDRNYVRMPYAALNWQKIATVLKQITDPIQSWTVVGDAIRQYHDYPDAIDFSGLEEYLLDKDDGDTPLSRACLFDLVPKIAKLAVELPNVCTRPIRLLRRQKTCTVAMSQYQAACLLANAFFCTYPPTAGDDFRDVNFLGLFRLPFGDRCGSQRAKLDCIFNYFRRVTTDMPTGVITFQRQVLQPGDCPKWKTSRVKLAAELRVSCSGRIEKDAPNMLHVDFANRYVGGGMLGRGCVQEEILFMLCPELIVSRLLTEVLDDNETLLMTGHQRFNEHVGYAASFRWNGDYVDLTDCDAWGRHTTQLVAMDALVLSNTDVYYQLSSRCLKRELNKAYCGFRRNGSEQRCTVATGNWGCGAFGGDTGVKFLVQLMAASLAERPVFYFTFDDFWLARLIYEAHKAAVEADWTVGRLWQYMQEMANHHGRNLSSERLLQGIIDQEQVPSSCSPRSMCIV